MKVVLDTNIYISAIFWEGHPHEVIQKALRKEIEVCISVYIVKEIEYVLRVKFQAGEDKIRRIISLILSFATLIETTKSVDAINLVYPTTGLLNALSHAVQNTLFPATISTCSL